MKTDFRPLPDLLRPLFWDADFSALDWQNDRDFIIRRILQHGSWQAIRWLRTACGDQALRAWLEAHSGGRLNQRQLRFWELILNLPAQEVEKWISQVKSGPWGRRVQR